MKISSSSVPHSPSEADLHPTFEEWKEELIQASLPTRNRKDLHDVTPQARQMGLLPPTALTARLWADIQAIPQGFETETVNERLNRVLRNAFLAVLQPEVPETDCIAEERLVFAVWLPTIGQEISDYPVVLRFLHVGPDTRAFLLMSPEEDSSR